MFEEFSRERPRFRLDPHERREVIHQRTKDPFLIDVGKFPSMRDELHQMEYSAPQSSSAAMKSNRYIPGNVLSR